MALETGNYVNDLVQTNPTASDPVSEGENHLQLIKKVLKQSFPSVDAAVNAIHSSASAPATSISAGLLWFDTTNNVLKLRNEANDAWITLAVSPVTSNSVDINAGTVDGAVIGGASAAAITGTTVVANTSVNIAGDGATVTGIKDEDNMASDSAVKLATQQSIKAYVDSQVTAQDLDLISDSGTIDIDLDSESLTVAGGEGIDTSATGTTLTIAGEDATTSNKGIASFDTAKFTVSSGAVTTKDSAIVGAVNLTGLADVDATGLSDDDILKYDATSSTWQTVNTPYPDKLTTKGDLLAYNTVASETRMAVGTNDYVLMADSSNAYGIAWKQAATATIADDAVTQAKIADDAVGADQLAGNSVVSASIVDGAIVNADINGSAAIDATKIANGSVTSTEFQYIGGLTSDAQTQINAKGVGDAVLANDQSWTGSQRATAVTDNDMSYDMNGGQNFISTPSGNATLTFTNIANGQSGFLKLINSGGHTISLHANSKADANLATTVSTAGTYLLSYFSDGTDVWLTNSAIYA